MPISGKKIISRNLSMPMIPGINSHSQLAMHHEAESYLDDHRVRVKK